MAESIFGSSIFGIAVLVLMAAFTVALIVLAILYAAKRSELSGRILGLLIGLMFLFNIFFQIRSLSEGAPFDLRLLSDLLISIAFLFASAGLLFKQANTICSIIFFILLGPGLILMAWTSDLFGVGAGGMHILSAIFALLWLSLLAMFAYGYVIRRKKAPDA